MCYLCVQDENKIFNNDICCTKTWFVVSVSVCGAAGASVSVQLYSRKGRVCPVAMIWFCCCMLLICVWPVI